MVYFLYIPGKCNFKRKVMKPPSRKSLFTFFILCVLLCNLPIFGAERPLFMAQEWNSGKAEVLEYKVKKEYLGKEMVYPAFFITEGRHYSPTESRLKRKPDKNYIPIINFSICYSFIRDSYPRHSMAILKIIRREKMQLIREDVSIQAWDGQILYEYVLGKEKPTINIKSWLEGNKKVVLEKAPVLTTEQLFLHLRGISLESGHQEKIWLLGSLMEDMVDTKVYYAEIRVADGIRTLNDQETRYITVTREDGKKMEFWLLADGLHQVAAAILADGTTYTLKKVEWKRYWYF